MNQCHLQRWSFENGFVKGRVNAITQSVDGYMWIGTERGLIRFDGQSFKQSEDLGQNRFALDHILGLVAEKSGAEWIRLLEPSLIRYEGGIFAAVRPSPAHDPLVTVMAPGKDGSTLFASKADGLFRSKGGSFQSVIAKGLLPYSPATSIAETPSDDIWLGTADAGLVRIRGGSVLTVQGLPSQRVTALLSGSDERLYVGTDRGLVLWNGTQLTTDGVPALLRTSPIWASIRDHDGNVWIGSEHGLIRFNAQGATSIDQGDSGGAVTALFEDREGDLWTGRDGLLTRIQDSPFVMYQPPISSSWDQGGPVHVDSRGDIWTAPDQGILAHIRGSVMASLRISAIDGDEIYSIAGNENDLWLGMRRHGLLRIVDPLGQRRLTFYSQVNGVPPNPVYVVHQSRDGTIWIGTTGGGAAHLQNGRFRSYTPKDGLASNTVFSISEGADGEMWFATPAGLSSWSGDRWRTYRLDDGLPSVNIYSTFVDSGGILWVGTLNGLAYVRSARVFAIPSSAVLPLRGAILGVTEDRIGSLWIVTSDSVFRVERAKLLAASLSQEVAREFGMSDGLLDSQGVRRTPSIATDASGTVWISRARSIVAIDPERVLRTAVATIVHVGQLLVDGSSRELAGPVNLHSDVKRVAIRYEGLNLSSPERIRYRFRLDGFDKDWNESDSNKEAVYTNLGPGSYLFHVAASNADHVWNGNEETLSFRVVPAFWQTAWFMATCGIFAIGAAILVYRLRIYRMTEQVKLQFGARFAERNRIAQDLHDTLLQSFQGLLLRFQAVENMLPDRPAHAKKSLVIAIDKAAQAITEGRDAVQLLRLDTGRSALVETLSALGQELSLLSNDEMTPSYRVLVEGTPRELHPRLQDDLYRISREAVANAFRHARASNIELDIRYDSEMLRLRVRDDGVGTDPEVLAKGGREGHWGLPGIQERADAMKGKLEIWSQLNRGTEIELSVPAKIAYMRAEKPKGITFLRGSK